MTILIIGSAEDEHALFIYNKLIARGEEPIFFDTRSFPSSMRLTLNIGREQDNLGCLDDGLGHLIHLDKIHAVYWRNHAGIHPPRLNDPFLASMAYREIESTIESLFYMLPAFWVNSPEAISMHTRKPYQLQRLQQEGIRIPKTLVTNNPEAVRAFYESLNGQVIYKPVRGGAHTAKLTQEDLTAERLIELAEAPVKFQEMIEGIDIRAYLVGNELFAAEIHSKTLDFRDDPQAPIVPIDLPEQVVKHCETVASTLGLVFTGMDIRKTPKGEYVFLESNPSPMFIHFENQTNYPISDKLVELLVSAEL